MLQYHNISQNKRVFPRFDKTRTFTPEGLLAACCRPPAVPLLHSGFNQSPAALEDPYTQLLLSVIPTMGMNVRRMRPR